MKRKILLALLFASLCATFAACGTESENKSSTVSSAPSSSESFKSNVSSTASAPNSTVSHTSSSSNSTPSSAVRQTIEPVKNFSIVGKWKSVGSYGFGQAQPGSIVVFDGTNCNFYSPKDTYAFYVENGKYRLDTTNVLFRDTISFTVDTIDNDTININYGSKVTQLKRVG